MLLFYGEMHLKFRSCYGIKITASHLLNFGIIDGAIKEPVRGAHTDYEAMASEMKSTIKQALDELSGMSVDDLRNQRYDKFRKMGAFIEG